jgi:hypothetical protein
MGWLSSLWDWMCGIVRRVWNWLRDVWNAVTKEVEKYWDRLWNKSTAAKEYFTLCRAEDHIQEKKNECWGSLCQEERDDMKNLLSEVRERQ